MDAMTLNNGPAPRSNGVSPAPPTTSTRHGGSYNARGGGQGRRGRGGGKTNGYQQGRDHHRQPHHIDNKIPSTDFDFQASNQKFDKSAAARQHSLLAGAITDATSGAVSSSEAPQMSTPVTSGGEGTTPVEDGDGQGDKATEKVVYNPGKSFFDNISSGDKATEKVVYNPSKSFFDNISSDANSKKPAPRPPGERGGGPRDGGEPGAGHGGRGRGRGGGYGRSRRDEEREKNVATFGEPGGVGLLGPGAYIGGYGGNRGRRRRGGQGGGGRGARGAGGGGAPRVAAVVCDCLE
jgi:protein LSM14